MDTRDKQITGTKSHKARTQQRVQRVSRMQELGWRTELATRDKTSSKGNFEDDKDRAEDDKDDKDERDWQLLPNLLS